MHKCGHEINEFPNHKTIKEFKLDENGHLIKVHDNFMINMN